MDEHNLCRVFDQVKPSPEWEEAMLDRLLNGERKAEPVNELKKIKKLTAALVAAALLLMACAFTTAIGLDRRILEFIGGRTEDEAVLLPGFSTVDMTSAAENGAELHISQVLCDRYNLVLLGELIAAEGTALDAGDYCFGHRQIWPLTAGEAIGFSGFAGWVDEVRFLEDEDPADNRISFLLSAYTHPFGGATMERVQLILEDLCMSGTSDPVVEGSWVFEFPMTEAAGWVLKDQELKLKGGEVTVSEIYLSPAMLQVEIKFEPEDFDALYEELHDPDWNTTIVLQDKEGNDIELEFYTGETSHGYGCAGFRLGEITDPAQIQGGVLTILGQNISLDSLALAEN